MMMKCSRARDEEKIFHSIFRSSHIWRCSVGRNYSSFGIWFSNRYKRQASSYISPIPHGSRHLNSLQLEIPFSFDFPLVKHVKIFLSQRASWTIKVTENTWTRWRTRCCSQFSQIFRFGLEVLTLNLTNLLITFTAKNVCCSWLTLYAPFSIPNSTQCVGDFYQLELQQWMTTRRSVCWTGFRFLCYAIVIFPSICLCSIFIGKLI